MIFTRCVLEEGTVLKLYIKKSSHRAKIDIYAGCFRRRNSKKKQLIVN
jgi:hypothetical protein